MGSADNLGAVLSLPCIQESGPFGNLLYANALDFLCKVHLGDAGNWMYLASQAGVLMWHEDMTTDLSLRTSWNCCTVFISLKLNCGSQINLAWRCSKVEEELHILNKAYSWELSGLEKAACSPL